VKILILGAGAWGTALAVHASRLEGRQVTLWARDASQVQAMQAQRSNLKYLEGVDLPAKLKLLSTPMAELADKCCEHQLVVIASPMAGLRAMLGMLQGASSTVAWLCKGFEPVGSQQPFGLLGHEIQSEVAPQLQAGVLSGPSFAIEVARGQPTALVAASRHEAVRQLLVDAFHSPTLRVYANDDLVGVEVGGAVKNVLAIATGLCDGLQLGLNARAALITRGLAEMTRLGQALGASTETFMGLSGLGDLVLTCTGDLSRNRKVGQLLAQGLNLQDAVASLGHVAEGVFCAQTVTQRARGLGVEMPITQAVVDLLDGRLQPQSAVAALMGRLPGMDSISG